MAALLSGGLSGGLTGCGGVRGQLRKAEGYLDEGRAKAAARIYDGVLEEHPDRAEALVGAAEAWSLAGEPQTALARAEAAQAQGVEGAQTAQGRALLALGRGTEAIPLLEGRGEPLLLAEAELAAGRLADAATVLPAPGTDPHADMLAAWLLVRARGEPGCAEALPLSTAAVAARDEDAELAAEASWLHAACGEAERARELHLVARAFERSDLASRLRDGNRRREGGDPEGAARLLARATVLYDTDGLVARELGLAWLDAGQAQRAVAALRSALALPPYQQDLARHEIIVGAHGHEAAARAALISDLWATLALALDRAGDPVNGAAAQERALLAKPAATALDWAAQARLWSKVRAHRQAVEAGRKAVQLDHASWPAWLALAEAQLGQGEVADSVGAARKAWALAPGTPEIAVALARGAIAAGDLDEARRALETALRELGPRIHPLTPTLQTLLRQASP